MERWKPTVEVSAREQRLSKLAGKSRKLFVFLREHRTSCSTTHFRTNSSRCTARQARGRRRSRPRSCALLQAYTQTSEAEAVRLLLWVSTHAVLPMKLFEPASLAYECVA